MIKVIEIIQASTIGFLFGIALNSAGIVFLTFLWWALLLGFAVVWVTLSILKDMYE